MSPPWSSEMCGGYLESEDWLREEGYNMDEDEYDLSEESDLSDDGSYDDGPRGHLWPDPLDEGTEASSTPPGSARSSTRINTGDSCALKEATLQLPLPLPLQPAVLPWTSKPLLLANETVMLQEAKLQQLHLPPSLQPVQIQSKSLLPGSEQMMQPELQCLNAGSSSSSSTSKGGSASEWRAVAADSSGAGDASCLRRPLGLSQEQLHRRTKGAEELQKKEAMDVSGVVAAEPFSVAGRNSSNT